MSEESGNIELRDAADSDLVVLRIFHGEHVVSITLYPDDVFDLMTVSTQWLSEHPDDRQEGSDGSAEESDFIEGAGLVPPQDVR